MIDLTQDWHTYCKYINWIPNPFQAELVNNLLRFDKIANITWARGLGKTAILGKLACFLAYRCGWTIIITAPIEGQFDEMLNEARQARDRLIKKPRYRKGNKIDV